MRGRAAALTVRFGSTVIWPVLVGCHIEMGVGRRARRGVMQGAKHSDAHRHREHSQRRSAPSLARKATSDFCVTVH